MKLNIGYKFDVTTAWLTSRTVIQQGQGLPPKIEEEVVSFRQVSANMIVAAVQAKYPPPKGIEDRSASKTWARALRSLNRALENDHDEMEVSREGVDFLKLCLEPYGCESASHVIVKETLLQLLEGKVPYADEDAEGAESDKSAAKNGVVKPEPVKV